MTDDTPTILQQINVGLRDGRDYYQRQAAWQRREMSLLRDDLQHWRGRSGKQMELLPLKVIRRLESIIHGAPVDDPATIEQLQHDLAAERAAHAETQRRLWVIARKARRALEAVTGRPMTVYEYADLLNSVDDNPIRVTCNRDFGDEQQPRKDADHA